MVYDTIALPTELLWQVVKIIAQIIPGMLEIDAGLQISERCIN